MKQVLVVILTVVLFLGALSIAPSYITSKSYEQLDYYVQPDGSVKIYNYSGSDTKVTIPETIEGKTVSGITPKSIGYKTVKGKKEKIDNFLINGYFGSTSYDYAKSEDILFNCLHKFEEKIVREATYVLKGEKNFVCGCGFSKTEEIPYIKIPDVVISSLKSNGEGVELKWQVIDGISEYNIYRSINGSEYQFLATSFGGSFVDSTANTALLKYYVVGIAEKNEGSHKIKPMTLEYFKCPELTLDSVKKGVKLKWTESIGAVKYIIYKKDSDGNYQKLAERKNSERLVFLDEKVKKQSQYYYSVVAVDNNGNESVRSETGKSVVYGKNSKVVYLTFDDGPSDNTLKILKILKKYDATATFFVTAADKPRYMSKIVNSGHAIALHTYSHDYKKIYKSSSAYFEDLNKISNLVKKHTGVTSKIIRFPGGSSNTISKNYCVGIMSDLVYEVEARGYRYFDWNVNSGDADGRNVSPNKILNNVKSASAGKDMCVVLMHDTAAKDTTVEALDSICAYYKSHGYEFASLTTESVACEQNVNN